VNLKRALNPATLRHKIQRVLIELTPIIQRNYYSTIRRMRGGSSGICRTTNEFLITGDSLNMAHAGNGGQYAVVWPRSDRQLQIKPLAKRLDTLNGKTVVQLWDYLFRGDEIFAMLEEDLSARYPGVRFVSWKDFGSTHGQDEREILASFTKRFPEIGADAVISGMGC
jgi:hypothetical protein